MEFSIDALKATKNHQSSKDYVLQVVIPRLMRKWILEELHAGVSGGHLGEDKMLGRLKERYYWPGHYADVKSWCKTCELCTTRKKAAPKQKAPLQTFAVASPMQLVHVALTSWVHCLKVEEEADTYWLLETTSHTVKYDNMLLI